jgi:hypothetical protein
VPSSNGFIQRPTDSQPANEDANSTAISLPRGVGDGWGVSEAVEAFVTTLDAPPESPVAMFRW